MPEPRVVALGGGHGLYSSLTALRRVSADVTAIVTVADDGGSSGRLRTELAVPPPGDLRMALSALCEDTDWGRTWRDVLQHRFASDGDLDGHAVGNLLIASLWHHTGDIVDGLAWVGRLLRAEGRVLPLALDALTIVAQVRGQSAPVVGQVAVATTEHDITDVWIEPRQPRVAPATVEAIDAADVVVLGPGSWYTSVLVHFLVPEIRQALVRAQDRCIVILNIAHEDVETAGRDRVDDVQALRDLAPEFTPAVVLTDTEHDLQDLRDLVQAWGSTLKAAPLAAASAPDRHDIGALEHELRDFGHKMSRA